MEASAFGLRWIVELLSEGGAPINRLIATGGLPHHNRTFVEVYADVLGMPIEIHPSKQGPAVGAAVLGMIAAGPSASGFPSVSAAAQAMAGSSRKPASVVPPRTERSLAYQPLYQKYRELAVAIQQLSAAK
jgi:L-ribulokinase